MKIQGTFTQAPIVKWLSQPSYERLFWVQFPVGAFFIKK